MTDEERVPEQEPELDPEELREIPEDEKLPADEPIGSEEKGA